MKVLLYILFLSVPMFGATRGVDCQNETPGSDTVLTCTLSGAVTSGQSVLCSVLAVSPSAVSVTDTGSQTWTIVPSPASTFTINGWAFRQFYIHNSTAITAITAHTGFGGIIMVCAAFSGLVNAAPDQVAVNDNGFHSGTASGVAFTSGNVTTTSASELLWGTCGDAAPTVVSYAPGAGWTLGITVTAQQGDATVFDMYRNVSSTGTYAATGTYSSADSGQQIGCSISTWQATAAAAGGATSGGTSVAGGSAARK